MAAIPVDPREELERLERKHAENPEGRYFVPLADAYRRSGDLSGAIDLLRAGLSRHPDYLSAHVVLGRCYADSGDPEAAEAEFRYILSLDPQNLIALRTLGDIALVDGRLREAERWYQDLLAVDPMNDDARSALRQLQEDEFAAARSAEWETGALEGGGEARPDDEAGREIPVAERFGVDDGLGDMVDLRSDDDRGALFEDDSDVVVTETIAELYTRQGFFDRAAEIYRELLRRRGPDAALETKLRRVESLASGSPEDAADLADSPTADRETLVPASPAGNEPSAELERDAPSTPDDSVEPTDFADSLYPLIGPAGDFGADGLDASDLDEEIEPQSPPAYDFASASGEEAGPAAGSDELDDLLIDPYADPFGSVTPGVATDLSARSFGSGSESDRQASNGISGSGGLDADPFADSFADGFPAMDEDVSLGDAVVSDDVSPSTAVAAERAPSGGMAIGAFLRSVATWSRSEPRSGTVSSSAAPPDASGGIERPDTDDVRPGSAEASSMPDSDGRTEDVSPAASTLDDMEFDAALGHTRDVEAPGSAVASGAVPAEPSGADDLRIVSGVDDLFPWEIPVPEPGGQALPQVQPVDLDPGYPFDDTPSDEAPVVDETVRFERSPSDAVEPSGSDGSEADDGSGPSEAGIEPGDIEAAPDAGPEVTDRLSSPPAEAQDDDDLESFQAWLRSLKR